MTALFPRCAQIVYVACFKEIMQQRSNTIKKQKKKLTQLRDHQHKHINSTKHKWDRCTSIKTTQATATKGLEQANQSIKNNARDLEKPTMTAPCLDRKSVV